MSYLGNAPESVFTEMKYQDLTGGSGTSFTLNQAVSNPQEIEVFVNNVRQEPSAAYSVSGTTLTMTESVGASEDFYVIFQGMAQGSATHPATQSLEAASVTSTGAISGTTITGTSFVSSGNMTFADNDKIILGTGSDLEIHHDGSHSIIKDAGTGNLQINAGNLNVNNVANSANMIVANDGGAVKLFHNGSNKLETNSGGVTVTGTAVLGGASFVDNATAYFGTGLDLRIYHDGGTSLIDDQGTGVLELRTNGSDIRLVGNSGSDFMVQAISNGAVNLSHDGSTKLATTSTGIDVTGIAVTDGLTSSAALDVTTSTHANASVFKSTGHTQLFLQDTDTSANLRFWGLQNSGGDINILRCNDDRASGFVTPMTITQEGYVQTPLQPSAQGRPSGDITNVTGDASTYYSYQGNGGSGTTTYTEVFDQNADFSNGTFTAPVTGKYLVCINVEIDGIASNHSSGVFYIITSNRNYQRLFQPRNMSNVGVNCGLPMTQIVDADANDVIRWALYIGGGSKTIDIKPNTNFGVHLLS